MSDLTGYDLTHKKIIDSGKTQFLKERYEKANLRLICKNAGVTTGAFYRHFDDKESLFISLVEQLANDILGFYTKFEKESFKSIEQNKENKLASINVNGSIESALYMYEKKDIFDLLIFKSYGCKYEDFLEILVSFEDRNRKRTLELVYKNKKNSVVISDEMIHLLNHAYIYGLCETIVHSEDKETLTENIKVLAEFFNKGWENLRGF